MSFLRKRPPVQSNRQQQARALAAGQASSNSGPTIKKKIPTSTTPQPVPGTYTDYKLVSTSRDVLHHVMRFHGQKIVTPNSFTAPVKLHRKKNENPHRGYYGKYSQYNQQQQQQAAKDATGDKKDGAASGAGTVGGATAGAPGGAAAPAATGANTALIAPYGGGVRNKQMLFKKRTRQIYIANEDERKKKEIEAAPWVLDDYDSQNNWTGQLEGGQGANYVLFVFAEDGFKVVPADKWYKFSPKLQYATLTAEEAEEQYQKSQKQSNSIRWLMRSKNKKAEDGEEGGEEDIETEQLLAVDHDDDAGYDEDEAKDRKKKRGKHGDVDEMDFDEVWQDDEEMPADMPGFDDDAKDDPRNKHGPQMDSDEDEDDEEDRARLNETGKAVKKALRKLEKNKAYDDDDDKDPYASDKDSSDSDLDEIDKEKEMKKEEDTAAAAGGNTPDLSKAKNKTKANAKAPLTPKKANATKPTASKPVSAKALKNKPAMPAPRNASAGTQPSTKPAGPSSSSTPRGSSPPAAVNGRAGSPTLPDKKRKKMDGASQEQVEDSPKKVARSSEASTSGAAASHAAEPQDDSNLITEAEVIALLRSRPRVTTRDLIYELKKKLKKDERNKNILAMCVKKVATPVDGVLVLKDGF
ncbi:Rap30/74 interaction domain-containing protein [Linnemannia elongata AG-77]|uniref:Transcription initiation factor IIF subunit alpha n=1 Tax=Linnemannia elongata AG-77 TaxID=1314771 RepID=A0A197KD67_9FUNG|nr:Rap30/74 interaction domain-containing protein [Linnemannia elongata AG-77]